jgi:hypothetical protein
VQHRQGLRSAAWSPLIVKALTPSTPLTGRRQRSPQPRSAGKGQLRTRRPKSVAAHSSGPGLTSTGPGTLTATVAVSRCCTTRTASPARCGCGGSSGSGGAGSRLVRERRGPGTTAQAPRHRNRDQGCRHRSTRPTRRLQSQSLGQLDRIGTCVTPPRADRSDSRGDHRVAPRKGREVCEGGFPQFPFAPRSAAPRSEVRGRSPRLSIREH